MRRAGKPIRDGTLRVTVPVGGAGEWDGTPPSPAVSGKRAGAMRAAMETATKAVAKAVIRVVRVPVKSARTVATETAAKALVKAAPNPARKAVPKAAMKTAAEIETTVDNPEAMRTGIRTATAAGTGGIAKGGVTGNPVPPFPGAPIGPD